MHFDETSRGDLRGDVLLMYKKQDLAIEKGELGGFFQGLIEVNYYQLLQKFIRPTSTESFFFGYLSRAVVLIPCSKSQTKYLPTFMGAGMRHWLAGWQWMSRGAEVVLGSEIQGIAVPWRWERKKAQMVVV